MPPELAIATMQYSAVDDGSSGAAQPGEAVRKGPWTMEEDLILVNYVAANGEGAWNSLARAAGLNRTGKSCRLRWLNYLRPDVRRGNISPEEHMLIVQLQAKWGNRWSKIARYLPGRTDNEIKNFWRTKIQKRNREASSAGTGADSTEAAAAEAEYRSMAAMVADDHGSSNSGRAPGVVALDYDDNVITAAAARQPSSIVRSMDHQLGCYAIHEGVLGGGGGSLDDDDVQPEFLQAAAAGDNFWALEDFWPTVPSLHGDC